MKETTFPLALQATLKISLKPPTYISSPAISQHRMAVAKASKFSPELFWRPIVLGQDLRLWVKLDVHPVRTIMAAWGNFNIVETTWILKVKQQSTGSKLNGTTDLWTHSLNLSPQKKDAIGNSH